ncbi:MAG TPA: zinc-binding alcohol dehydrogenase family protein [Acetobacteraceae bacterium]|nr:zinc-binding alcohol dehydrogenase family protein [Acetobacteraceae bacterium]
MPTKMTALSFSQYGAPSVLSLIERDIPTLNRGEVLVEVKAAAINPSDIRIVEGLFHSPLPRVPGRDYAGTVVAGDAPAGQEVWGSGPRFGIDRDGAHAKYVVVAADWISAKPAGLSMEQAASVGVPFITAWSALVTSGNIQAGETILIIGAAGAVGRAATQIAVWKGAKVIPAIRAKGEVPSGTINTLTDDIPRAVRDLNGGEGADLVLDCVGGALFEPALTSLREGGRHLVIVSKGMRRVSFDLTDFYHNKSHLIGVDSLGLTGTEIASIMDRLRPGFEACMLRPFEVTSWPLARAIDAYEAAERDGARAKHVLLPS